MKTKNLFLSAIIFSTFIFQLLTFNCTAQTWTFGKNVAMEAYDTRGTCMTKGLQGSFFTGGAFSDTVKIGTNTYTDTKVAFYIAKQDVAGSLVWSICDKGKDPGTYYTSVYSALRSLTCDTSGNIFAFGNWGVYASMDKLFLYKYNSTGVKQWGAWIDAPVSAVAIASCADDSGNVYITGHAANTITFYDGDGFTTQPNNTLIAGGAGTEFLAKYNAAGMFQWVKEYTNPYTTRAKSLTVTNDGILLCGKTSGGGTVDFGNGVTAVITNLKEGSFITKYDFNGLAQWALKAEGTGCRLEAITLDSNLEIIICGDMYNGNSIGAFTTIPTGSSQFVGKANSSGVVQWVSFETAFLYNTPMGIALSNNSILVVGKMPVGGNGDAIAAQRYNNTGNLLAYDTTSTDTYGISAASLITTSTGDIWLSGGFCGTLIEGNVNLTGFCSPNHPRGNIFLAKITATGGIVASLENLEEKTTDIVLFPNPTSGSFVIQPQDSQFKIEICNVLGETIYSTIVKQQTTTEINLSAFPKGLYFVNFREGEKRHSKKIVVQ